MSSSLFFFHDTATTEIYTLSLHDALPILDTSVNAANQVVSVGADIAFDADPKFFACLVRFESSSVPTTLPTAYDVYPLDGRNRRRLKEIGRAVQQESRDQSRIPSSASKKK